MGPVITTQHIKKAFKALAGVVGGILQIDRKIEEEFYKQAQLEAEPKKEEGAPEPKEINFASSYIGGGSISEDEMDSLPDDFPVDRMQRYRFIRKMKEDPIVALALKFHTSCAVAWNEDKSEVVTIRPKTDKPDIYTKAVQEMFAKLKINEQSYTWGINCAAFGDKFIRVYGEKGKGITFILDNETTRPHEVYAYEQSGNTRGYLAPRWQQVGSQGYPLIEPWEIIHFRMPGDRVLPENVFERQSETDKPQIMFDMARKTPDPRIVESFYGDSMIAAAYQPWVKLQKGLASISQSRWNKSKRDRMAAIGFGNSNPSAALEWVNNVAEMLHLRKKAEKKRQKSWTTDSTIDNYIIPYSTNDGGKIDFSIIDPNADITAVEDIRVHVSMLCGSLGIDPATAGFTDQIAGGLGEGSYNRTSVVAAVNSTRLRRAVDEGLWQLALIHLAWKFGKTFDKNTAPFTMEYHAISNAKELEEQENIMSRMEFWDRYAGLVLTLETGDKEAIAKHSSKELGLEPETIKEFFPKAVTPPPGTETEQIEEF